MRAGGPRGVDAAISRRQRCGSVAAVGQQEPYRAPMSFDEPRIQANSAASSTKSLFMPKAPRAGGADRAADGDQLLLLGEMPRDQLAGRGLVRIGAGGREAERAGPHRLLGQPRITSMSSAVAASRSMPRSPIT